jgi:hypothetical protein
MRPREGFPAVIDVLQKGVDGAHPLFDAALQPGPFAPRDDAGDDVERDQALIRALVAIDVEGDAGAARRHVLAGEETARRARHPVGPGIAG